jgi:hypothetical protein
MSDISNSSIYIRLFENRLWSPLLKFLCLFTFFGPFHRLRWLSGTFSARRLVFRGSYIGLVAYKVTLDEVSFPGLRFPLSIIFPPMSRTPLSSVPSKMGPFEVAVSFDFNGLSLSQFLLSLS